MKRINKKGSEHIDWVVSMGIFLTFVIVLLAFIKPSYKPEYEGDVLISIVENELMKRAEWDVKRASLSLDCESSGIISFNLNEYIPDLENFQILNKNLLFSPDIYSTSGGFKLQVQNGANQFIVVYSQDSYPSGNLQGNPSNPECKKSAGNPAITKGLRESKLNLGDLQMDQWNFPQFRHFRIRVLDSNGQSKGYCFADGGITGSDCENIQIPEQIQIFAADKGEFFLNGDLTKTQIILNILVW